MGFTEKDWRNATTHEGGGDETTPLSAAALEDLETRLSGYTDLHGAATSVKDAEHGATGDGVTDDSNAFASARDGAGVGGHVYVPPGTYIVKGLYLTLANQTWTFAPGAKMKFPTNGGGVAILEIRAPGVSLIGGEWDGNDDNQTSPSFNSQAINVNGAAAYGTKNVLLRDLYVHDTQSGGIGLPYAPQDVTIDRCRIIKTRDWGISANNTGGGAGQGQARGIRISNCYIDTTDSEGSYTTPITVYGDTGYPTLGLEITNCYLKTDPLDGGGIEPRYVDGCQISNCTIQGSLLGITIGGDCDNTTIIGNTIRGVGSAAGGISIEIGDSAGVAVVGNTIEADGGSADGGIELSGASSTDVLISGNVIRDLPVGTGSIRLGTNSARVAVLGNYVSGRGLTINDPCTDIMVSGNMFVSPGGAAGYALQYDSLTTADKNITIANNTFTDYSSAAISLYGSSGAATLSELIVKDNVFNDCADRVAFVGTTPTLDATCFVEGLPAPTVASGATVTLPPHIRVVNISGTADITSITADDHRPDPVTLIFTGTAATTGLTDGSNLKLSANLGYTPDDTITLVCDGTNWYETGRSVN